MLQINTDLVNSSEQSLNPLGERTLKLAGEKITVIEGLASTQDQYDCIDLSENDITKLANFSVLKRLKSLILSNNRISKISNVSNSIPNLENLVLINNKISQLSEIDNLSDCNKLERLVLFGNTITKQPNYRLYTIARIPSLRILDFQKVGKQEREEAQKKFQFENSQKDEETLRKEKIKKLIENATSVEEVNRIELLLKSGELGNKALFDKTFQNIKN